MRLEAAGHPTVVIATRAFATLARQTANAYGLPEARIAVIPHPLGGIAEAAVVDAAVGVVEEVLGLLTGSR